MQSTMQPTISACAALAEGVYNNNTSVNGWTKMLHRSAGDKGFFGASYYQGQNVIIALRGTQEAQDVIDDLYMVPNLNGEAAEKAILKMVQEYCKGYPASAGIKNSGTIAKKIFSTKGVRKAAESWGNQVPPSQATSARLFSQQTWNYCQAKNLTLRCFVGHSLGGALAQYLSEQTASGGLLTHHGILAVTAVAFNSPNMGKLKGMRENINRKILIINTRLDPLSFLTREIGNESHAKDKKHEFSLELPPFDPPPNIPETPTIAEWMTFNKWLVKAMSYYHSIEGMRALLGRSDPGQRLLSSFFP